MEKRRIEDFSAGLKELNKAAQVKQLAVLQEDLKTYQDCVSSLNNEEVEGIFEKIIKTKNKKTFQEQLVIMTGLVKKASTMPVLVPLDKVELESLADVIRENIETAQSSAIAIGAALSRALEMYSKAGLKQPAFLEWAWDNCSIKKAQAYKLMTVNRMFGAETAFKGVAMRVLYLLANQPQEVIDKAKVLAEAGKLDSVSVHKIAFKEGQAISVTPPPPAVVLPPGAIVVKQGVKEETKTDSLKGDAGKEWVSEEEQIEELKAEIETLKSNKDVIPVLSENDTIAILQATIQTLNDTISELQKDLMLARDERSRKVKTEMPVLPQFTSSNPCTVLGLLPEKGQDKTAINAQFRAMAKIFTKATCPAGAESLATARDTLLAGV